MLSHQPVIYIQCILIFSQIWIHYSLYLGYYSDQTKETFGTDTSIQIIQH